ncbi:sulfotransferase [Aliifodinibius salicampi]|uniref:Sulfotransferase n=1 Tax=Fodinibius salicampi TaxID=1920655 RepID=A0ABT3PV68_9BACT|nr:sulfotransferase [Fodinibius salicampi]MCW9711749.1 sulfotransferase [Fodinibius salicampi]
MSHENIPIASDKPLLYDKRRPIFIVGIPRSGTTLLAALISSHSEIACGPETHFFSKTSFEQRQEAVEDPNWPEQAVSLITSIKLSGQFVYKLFKLSKKQIYTYLKDSVPSQQAMLESLTAQFAKNIDKPFWAEKTPNHLLHLPEILNLYPNASIIQIIRDPRDACNSMKKLPHASDSAIINSYHWYRLESQLTNNEKLKNSISVRYEDLVNRTTFILDKICTHIGIQHEGTMFDPTISARHLVSPKETWKNKVSKPINSENVYKWKSKMPAKEAKAISLICHEGIFNYQYPDPIRPKTTIPVFGLDWHSATIISKDIIALSEKNIFLKPAKNKELLKLQAGSERILPLLELPKIGQKRVKRLFFTIRIIIRLLIEKFNGTKILYWSESKPGNSLTSRFIQKIITVLGTEFDIHSNDFEKGTEIASAKTFLGRTIK